MRLTALWPVLLSGAAFALVVYRKQKHTWVVAPARIRVVPQAESWLIPVTVLARKSLPGPLVLEGVYSQGRDLSGALDTPLPVERAGLLGRGMKVLWEVRISAARLPFAVEDRQDYPVEVRLRCGSQVSTCLTVMAVRSMPADPDWVPADLHLHSLYSDGNKSPADIALVLKDEGYRVAYLTDHTDGISAHGWTAYREAVIAGSIGGQISLYPGAEITVVGQGPQGDLLAYGIGSLTGLENKTYPPQGGIDRVLANYPPGPSSPALAHPCGNPSWDDWSVSRYRGMELMSRFQTEFGEGAAPMVRWRSELTRLLASTFAHGFFASVRSGSDWHASPLDVGHRQYVTWIRTARWDSQGEVDKALYQGRTVVSEKGGLAYMTVSYSNSMAITAQVGDRLVGVPSGASLALDITFWPVESGTYTVKVYQDDRKAEAFTWTGSCSGGTGHHPAVGHRFQFPGGVHYYCLSVVGPDHIYSSPIFVCDQEPGGRAPDLTRP
ncbi:MAG TPA: phosphoesterase [Firmicutes bacterium]|nr:phosphoesterase [Bacillota bacterium]